MEHTHKSAAAFALSLLAGLVLVAVLGVDASLGQTEEAQRRPNIVFVLTDDQMPGTENRMPALQSNLVEKGTKFTNMTSTFPLCCPGRATLLRGQYPHSTKIYGNSPRRAGGRSSRPGACTRARWRPGSTGRTTRRGTSAR